MAVARPRSLIAALDALADRPAATVLGGGTDLMVDVNAGQRHLTDVVALRRVDELAMVEQHAGGLHLGAGLTWAGMEAVLAEHVPALAAAGRSVGSRQIRNTGTLGGNLGSASWKASTPPVLYALDATIDVRSAGGRRDVPVGDFIVAEGRTTLAPGELIAGVDVPACRGPQRFLKLGNRSSVISAVVAVAVVLDLDRRRVRVAVGSAAGVPQRLSAAEGVASDVVDWDAGAIDDDGLRSVRRAVGSECLATSDHRAGARFRRHAAGVLVARGLASAVTGGRPGAPL